MANTSSPVLRYEKRDRKAYLILNRPEAMNAINVELADAVSNAAHDADQDDDILVVIVIGEGGRAFSAGADLKEMTRIDGEGKADRFAGLLHTDGIAQCGKPVIAAIDGYCLAGGLELSLRCDMRIATAKSTFGLPEPRRSLLAGYGLHNLSRMVPLGEALYMQLSGVPIAAERAFQIGLIQKVVPDREALLKEVEWLAEEIKQCAPLAVRAIKKIVMTGRNLPVEYSQKLGAPVEQLVYNSEDRLEGPKAFAEKRKPVWKMR